MRVGKNSESMDYKTAKVPMEVDFHGEIDNRLSPSGIQKVQEDLFQRGRGYRGLEGNSRLMIDTTMIHIGREIDRRPESDKRSGMDFQDLVDTPQKVKTLAGTVVFSLHFPYTSRLFLL